MMKGEPTTDRKIFANDISDKGLVSKIYIFFNFKLYQIFSPLTDFSLKRIYRKQIKTEKLFNILSHQSNTYKLTS